MFLKNRRFVVKKNYQEINPEEIFLDAKIKHQMQDPLSEAQIETPFLQKKFFWIFFGAFIFIFILIGKTAYFSFWRGTDLKLRAQHNSQRLINVPALRGIIYDKNYSPLVENIPSFSISLLPQDLPKDDAAREKFFQNLADDLGLKKEDLLEAVKLSNNSFEPIPIAQNISYGDSLKIKTRYSDYQAVIVNSSAERKYAYESLSPIIGYAGLVNQKEVKDKNLSAVDFIGKLGLEKSYDDTLRGKDSVSRIVLDANGKIQQKNLLQDSHPGNNLILTLDKNLQDYIFNLLSVWERQGAAAVVLNPKNGEILSLVSLPSFDANIFSEGDAQKIKNIFNDPSAPLLNRTVSGTYPSGSTIKPFMALAALSENIVKPEDTIYDTGEITITNQYDPSIIYRYRDWKAHGLTNMIDAIAESCDVYFYTIGGGYGKIKGLGPDLIAKYLNLFGFGRTTGVDLPQESGGLVPTPEWKQSKYGEKWSLGDTYHYAIGQGYFLTTPLQLANATAALINGGTLWKPHLVSKITDSQKNIIQTISPQKMAENIINNDYANIIKEGMRAVVTRGTAQSLQSVSQEVAGKTGTAQFGNEGKTHAWFVGYAPYKDPEIVVVVLVQGGGEGSSAAVPVAKEIFNWYFANKK
jgi:penicillin-binding protein 2